MFSTKPRVMAKIFKYFEEEKKDVLLFEESYFKIWILMKDWIGCVSSNDDFLECLSNYVYGEK